MIEQVLIDVSVFAQLAFAVSAFRNVMAFWGMRLVQNGSESPFLEKEGFLLCYIVAM